MRAVFSGGTQCRELPGCHPIQETLRPLLFGKRRLAYMRPARRGLAVLGWIVTRLLGPSPTAILHRAALYLAAYESARPLSDPERSALPSLLRLFVLQYVIFHALLCIEESKTSPADRWVLAMQEDLQRDDELTALGTARLV